MVFACKANSCVSAHLGLLDILVKQFAKNCVRMRLKIELDVVVTVIVLNNVENHTDG